MFLFTQIRKVLFFYLLIIVAPCAWGAKWEITPSVSGALSYSDNINLSQNDRNGDAALTITPAVTINGKGGRVNLTADYALQIIRYRDNTQANDEYHSAGMSANLKLVPDTFFLDTNVRYGQQSISLTAPSVPQNNIAITTNRTNTLTYLIKPSYQSRLDNVANLQADYTYEGVRYDNNTIQDQHVRNTGYHVGLSSPEANRNLNWSLNHTRSDYGVQADNNNYHSMTDLELRYRLTARLSLLANGGDEQNHFANTQLGQGDSYWSGGFIWTPTTRTSIEVRRGERFFGNTTKLSISREGKRSHFSLTYDEDITTTSSIQANTSLIPGFVVLAVVDDVVLQEALHATLSANTAKTDYGMTVDNRKITYQSNINQESYKAYSLFWNWRIYPRSTIGISGTRQISEFITTNQEVVLRSHEISFERAIGKHGSSSLRYIHYANESSNGVNEYDSDFYQFTLTWNFR